MALSPPGLVGPAMMWSMHLHPLTDGTASNVQALWCDGRLAGRSVGPSLCTVNGLINESVCLSKRLSVVQDACVVLVVCWQMPTYLGRLTWTPLRYAVDLLQVKRCRAQA